MPAAVRGRAVADPSARRPEPPGQGVGVGRQPGHEAELAEQPAVGFRAGSRPPPVATIPPWPAGRPSRRGPGPRSRGRRTRRPRSKIARIERPSRASTSRSASANGRPSRSARIRPTVDLPVASVADQGDALALVVEVILGIPLDSRLSDSPLPLGEGPGVRGVARRVAPDEGSLVRHGSAPRPSPRPSPRGRGRQRDPWKPPLGLSIMTGSVRACGGPPRASARPAAPARCRAGTGWPPGG